MTDIDKEMKKFEQGFSYKKPKTEYGGDSNWRMMKTGEARMNDSEGNVILCKCGKPAGSAAMGKDAMIAWCSDCSPMNKQEEKIVYVYKNPDEMSSVMREKFEKAKELLTGCSIEVEENHE